VVGIGASAGGLDATKELLKALPAETGMAFVVVHHLAPGRSSMLSEILARSTTMPVQPIEDGMAVSPNHVYVIPPGAGLELLDGKLRLIPREKGRVTYRPIDTFFRSLASEQRHRSIGVILSGTANDGTAGCEEIKAEGGITFAQDDTAQENGMPRSAVAAGCIDFVLSPTQIAESIRNIAAHPLVALPGAGVHVDTDRLSGILEPLRLSTGVDFTHYKRATLVRRIARRMVLHKLTEIKDYERFLAGNPAEVEALFQDILINVTSFFRNPEAFELLKSRVFPALTTDRSRALPIRIWTLGCSTGEEAYSIAIAISEFAAATGRPLPVQIFASDLSSAGIVKARAGIYSKAIEQDVSPERLRRYFVDMDGGYRVNKAIRDMVVFARHNALIDPPFSHVDLISCRNLLIYLDATLQQRLVPTLHYALNPSGFILLGPSETIGPYRSLFELVDTKSKLYQRKPGPALHVETPRRRQIVAAGRGAVAQPDISPRIASEPAMIGSEPQREADRILLSRYAPAGVLVNEEFEVLQFRGDTSPYLTPAPGRASFDLIRMLREGLVMSVRAALVQAKRDKRPVRQGDIRHRVDGESRVMSVEVIPIGVGTTSDTCYMVVFDDAASARARARPAAKADHPPRMRGDEALAEIQRLRQELAASREYLQSVIEQQEAANEELQSANEEVQSTNEELQSINEELETSKEELQSSAEELATVNDELHNRNLELTQSHNDLTNLISSVQIPIVMLGPDFRIRRFTPSAESLLNLIGTDVGRPITDLKSNIDIPDLEHRLHQVLDTVAPQEFTTQERNGRWYLLRLRPYRTLDNRIDGVVMSFVDIESLMQAEAALRRSANRLAILQDDAPLGIRECDADGRITRVNEAYCEITGYRREELLGRSFLDFVLPEDRPQAEEQWRQTMTGATARHLGERRLVHKLGHEIWVETQGFALRNESGAPSIGVAFEQDVTARKRAQSDLVAADRSKTEFLAMLAHELRNPLAPLLNVAELLTTDLPPERFAELRTILERQIRNLSRMTDDLLDLSRISQGRLQLRREVVDLRGVVRRVADLFRPTLDARSQQFSVSITDEPLFIHADPVRIEQVIDNLLTNASKFTGAGGHIRVRLAASGDEAAELRVSDDGAGIADSFLSQIFDPFTQADDSLDRRRGGLGIGLTLVRRVVELHGGDVTVTSGGLGMGAEFAMRLPRAPAPATRGTGREPVAQPTAPRGLRVAVVDDNTDGAETLAMLLHRAGHEVSTIGDGLVAVDRIVEFGPDVVLLDLGLPGKDGFEVARDLRRLGGKRIPLVALSGYGQDSDRHHAAEVGIDHYFTKPVDIPTLLELLGTIAE
jgi:two-component system CheB/CheR fusion protein